MTHRIAVVAFLAVVAGFVGAPTASAVTIIDFEGIAPANGQTTEDGSVLTFGNFSVNVPHGHVVSNGAAVASGNRPVNGSDWLLHDHYGPTANQPVTTVEMSGGAFSLLSLDFSEWESDFGTGRTLTVTGHLQGGGTLVANLVSDAIFGFQTAFFVGWDNLVQLDLLGDNASPLGSCFVAEVCGSMAYDNIVVAEAPIPEPTAALLFGAGLLVARWTLRRRNA